MFKANLSNQFRRPPYEHYHAVVRVDGLPQLRCAHSGLRTGQSRTEVVVLKHLKNSPCDRRELFCMSSMPLFLYASRGGGDVTSINPKYGLRQIRRS